MIKENIFVCQDETETPEEETESSDETPAEGTETPETPATPATPEEGIETPGEGENATEEGQW